jgi:hypothetical protein
LFIFDWRFNKSECALGAGTSATNVTGFGSKAARCNY